MYALEVRWNAWITSLETRGVAARALLKPGASEDEIEALEATIGARLPAEARELYSHSNGQTGIFQFHPHQSGMLAAPIFGGYEFNSLERTAWEWTSWREIRDQSSAEELEDFDRSVDVRAGHPVRKLYTHPLWVPFATDGGGNSLALDLDPCLGGARGQIIVIGSDEDERRVLAPGLVAFLTNITQLLEAGRLTITRQDRDAPIAFFDIEPGFLQ